MEKNAAKGTKVAIVGGGLVGSLCASFLARRGYEVCLYEYREDVRRTELAKGRSINLALSARGRKALAEIGLEDLVVKGHGIPLRGRMIHNVNGSRYAIPYDSVSNQCIYSVSRKYLNDVLLTAPRQACRGSRPPLVHLLLREPSQTGSRPRSLRTAEEAEKHPKVKITFCRKLVDLNLREGSMTFLCTDSNEVVKTEADLIVGADGAYSRVRKEITKQPLCNYSQEYIQHGYLELSIPATSSGDFAMEPNFLHIWPRGSFMMIALPNQDKTWTVTLFMPFAEFQKLTDAERLLRFFEAHFPDALPLMTRERLARDFFAVEPAALVSIKCTPYHYRNRVLIIGDAAHAMVPFYGQGMNAGFEDCLLLNQLMAKHCDRLDSVLPEFSRIRNPDAEAICDLAMYNYIEMRDLVNRRSFLLRKRFDDSMHRVFPKVWVPLYNSVTFTDTNYSQCVRNKRRQDKVVTIVLIVLAAEIFFFAYLLWVVVVNSG